MASKIVKGFADQLDGAAVEELQVCVNQAIAVALLLNADPSPDRRVTNGAAGSIVDSLSKALRIIETGEAANG
jgi:hypothetical protein